MLSTVGGRPRTLKVAFRAEHAVQIQTIGKKNWITSQCQEHFQEDVRGRTDSKPSRSQILVIGSVVAGALKQCDAPPEGWSGLMGDVWDKSQVWGERDGCSKNNWKFVFVLWFTLANVVSSCSISKAQLEKLLVCDLYRSDTPSLGHNTFLDQIWVIGCDVHHVQSSGPTTFDKVKILLCMQCPTFGARSCSISCCDRRDRFASKTDKRRLHILSMQMIRR